MNADNASPGAGGSPQPRPAVPVNAAVDAEATVSALDAIDSELDRLAGLSTADQVVAFEAIHRQLGEALASTGNTQQPSGSRPQQQPAPGRQPHHQRGR
jgi:hypothetical protein